MNMYRYYGLGQEMIAKTSDEILALINSLREKWSVSDYNYWPVYQNKIYFDQAIRNKNINEAQKFGSSLIMAADVATDDSSMKSDSTKSDFVNQITLYVDAQMTELLEPPSSPNATPKSGSSGSTGVFPKILLKIRENKSIAIGIAAMISVLYFMSKRK